MSLRAEVFALDGGRCVATGVRLSPNGSTWQWAAHHPLTQQQLKRNGLGALVKDPRFACLVARRPHERHHSRHEPIPLERLPARCVEAIDALGPWAQDLLRRYHPPLAGAGRNPADERWSA